MKPSHKFGVTGWRAPVYNTLTAAEWWMAQHRIPGCRYVRCVALAVGQVDL